MVGAFATIEVMNSSAHRSIASGTVPFPSGEMVNILAKSAPPPAKYCENLHRAVCGSIFSRDPTGVINSDIDGELQATKIYEDIIRAHPDWTSSQVDEELVQTIYTPKRLQRLERAFNRVRRTMERFIEDQPPQVFSDTEKRQLISHLKKVVLNLPPPASVYEDEPDLFTKNDVFYERFMDGTTRLRVGGAYFFTAKSWFNIVFTLAHEMAHSIDPCEMRAQRLSLPAYDRLGGCLLANGVVAARKTRQECGQDDQLSEAFADWFAVQVTAETLKRYSQTFDRAQIFQAAANSVRDLCEQDNTLSLEDDTFHPSPEVRIERIFGDHPLMREIIGCGPRQQRQKYCGFDWSQSQ